MTSAPAFSGLVEFRPGFAPRPQISHVLLDFDGTLSLIREGWPEVMVPMFMEMLPRQPGETDNDIRRLMTNDIMRLNGKQTIYQMMQLADEVRRVSRGGASRHFHSGSGGPGRTNRTIARRSSSRCVRSSGPPTGL